MLNEDVGRRGSNKNLVDDDKQRRAAEQRKLFVREEERVAQTAIRVDLATCPDTWCTLGLFTADATKTISNSHPKAHDITLLAHPLLSRDSPTSATSFYHTLYISAIALALSPCCYAIWAAKLYHVLAYCSAILPQYVFSSGAVELTDPHLLCAPFVLSLLLPRSQLANCRQRAEQPERPPGLSRLLELSPR